MPSYMQAVSSVYEHIETVENNKAAAIAERLYEELYASTKHYVSRLGKTYILGYKPHLWRLSSFESLAFFENGQHFNLLSTMTNIYQIPTYIVGIAFTCTALEASLMLHMKGLSYEDYGKFNYLISRLEGIGYDLEEMTAEYGIFDIARQLPI